MIESKESKENINWLDSSILIALVTALGYYVAYSYKKGFLGYYGITDVFLNQISITSVILSISIMSSSIFSAYTFYLNAIAIFKNENNPLVIIFKNYFVPLLTIVFFSIPFFKGNLVYIFFLTLFIIVWLYIIPIFTYWKVKGYSNKLRKKLDKRDPDGFTLEKFLWLVKSVPSVKFMVVISIFLLGSSVANLFGNSKAKSKTEYMLIEKKGGEYLVIENSGDNFIIAPLNSKNKTIKQEFLMIDIKSDIDKPTIYKKVIIDGGITSSKAKKY
ncbi:hypothetical protein [Peribacillus frigoritolerans]|uniref:hypothetical protein n=1 Tax=Peribacillus frigoritolerans TaxID=450367 RepID=UPI000FD88AE3|nr:hypothetical protein [Peribacillus frigoritolerans]AZV60315.1 hypothetical protein DOZ91_06545 [Peribacillus frigoritolerans]